MGKKTSAKRKTHEWLCYFEFMVRGGREAKEVMLDGETMEELRHALTTDPDDESHAFAAFESLDGNLYYVNRKHLLTWSFEYDVTTSIEQMEHRRAIAAAPPGDDDPGCRTPTTVNTRFVDGQEGSVSIDLLDIRTLRTLVTGLAFGHDVLHFHGEDSQVFVSAENLATLSIPQWIFRAAFGSRGDDHDDTESVVES